MPDLASVHVGGVGVIRHAVGALLEDLWDRHMVRGAWHKLAQSLLTGMCC